MVVFMETPHVQVKNKTWIILKLKKNIIIYL